MSPLHRIRFDLGGVARLDSLLGPYITFAFWVFAAIVLLNVRGLNLPAPVEQLIQEEILACCLILMGLSKAHLRQALGTAGVLFLAAIASYLFISFAVSVATGAELLPKADFYLRTYTLFGVFTLATVLGGRAVLERIGMERLSNGVLIILVVSCTVILASPVLDDISALSPSRWSGRIAGTFNTPNDTGFVACLAAALALSFMGIGRRRGLAYLGATMGSTAVIASGSRTSLITLVVLLVYFLMLNGRGERGRIARWMVVFSVLTSVGVAIYWSMNREWSLLQIHQLEEIAKFIAHLEGKEGYQDFIERQYLLKMSSEKILESPIVGNGIGQLHQLYRPPGSRWLSAHNQYLLLAGEAGFIPLTLYVLSLFLLLRSRWVMPKSLTRDVVVSWAIVIALAGLAHDTWFKEPFYAFAIGLACAIVAGTPKAAVTANQGVV